MVIKLLFKNRNFIFWLLWPYIIFSDKADGAIFGVSAETFFTVYIALSLIVLIAEIIVYVKWTDFSDLIRGYREIIPNILCNFLLLAYMVFLMVKHGVHVRWVILADLSLIESVLWVLILIKKNRSSAKIPLEEMEQIPIDNDASHQDNVV